MAISPQVFVLWPCTHGGTTLTGAKLHEYAVEHINFIVEFYSVDGEPLIEVFARWELNCKLHVPATESHSGYLLELVAPGSLLDFLLLLERLGFVQSCSETFDLWFLHFKLINYEISYVYENFS